MIRNQESLDFSKPSIIIANHTSFLDILLMIMLNPKVIIMVKKWVYNSPVFGPFIRYSGYLFIEEGTNYNLELIQKRVDDGYSIVVFPEGTRSRDGEIKRFHKGAFYLAQELKLDIQPIIIFGAYYVNPKNDFIIKSGSLILVVMNRIKCSDALFKLRFGLMTKEITKMMREELINVSKKEQTPNYLKKRIFYNYLYKSPIVEWYVKIKWRMESENYKFYDSLIGGRSKVYDIGCGLGYLGYYLHYRDSQRKIIGIDYDDHKIKIAQNGYDKTDQLLFLHGDIRNLEIENADVVLFNDVLHYMSSAQQLQVLEKTASNLNENGMILIRDGITDLEDRHSITKTSEKYSTKIIKFNKTTNELSFFSSKDIFNFAAKQNLECEMVEQSKRTSNVLFILRKLRNGERAG
jgi:1-acyl-sn-glycerol-3-phosphate acyltransferase